MFKAPLCTSQEPHSFNDGLSIHVLDLPSSNEVSGGAFFMRPSGSPDYNVNTSPLNPDVPTPILSPDWAMQKINTNFTPGFFLNLRHVFSNKGSDVTVYWAHLRTTNNDNNVAANNTFDGPLYAIGPESFLVAQANGAINFSYDVVNGDVAKHIAIDSSLSTRFLAGITGIWLNQQLTQYFSGQQPSTFQMRTQTSSKFNGAGLRVGVDVDYQFKNQFSLVGFFASSLILGTQSPTTTFTGTSDLLVAAGIPVNHQSLTHPNFSQIIPAMDGKLGVRYSHDTLHGLVYSLEAGYQGVIYINAIQNYVPTNYADNSPGIDTGAIFLKSVARTVQDFTLSGPYITASIKK